jgi:hypothetical protein
MKRPTHKEFLWSYGFCGALGSGLVLYWLLGYEGDSLAETIAASAISFLAGLCILQVGVAAIIVELGRRSSDTSFTVVRRLAGIAPNWSRRSDQDKSRN